MSVGHDILFDKVFDSQRIIEALSETFNLSKKFIDVESIDDIGGAVSKENKIYCLISDVEGMFKQKVSLFIKTPLLSYNEVNITRRISRFLDTKCLISNTGNDPSSMILIDKNVEDKIVHLDLEDLESGEYNLKTA